MARFEVGVLEDVVQQCGGDQLVRSPSRRDEPRDLEGMSQILLVAVCLPRKSMRATDQVHEGDGNGYAVPGIVPRRPARPGLGEIRTATSEPRPAQHRAGTDSTGS